MVARSAASGQSAGLPKAGKAGTMVMSIAMSIAMDKIDFVFLFKMIHAFQLTK